MKSGLNFLLAARQCEIAELEQLARTSELVGVLGHFTHALQRERGISNVYLGTHGDRFSEHRMEQLAQCERIESVVRARLDGLDTEEAGLVRNGARLFSRIAVVLHAMDSLPALREGIGQQSIAPAEATAAFSRLIAGLLAVVFEAADSATDPEVSRALVAMFNYMQGKEFAGQERALGAAVFASGSIDAAARQQCRYLIESQQTCLQVFADLSDAAVVAADRAAQDTAALGEIEHFRRLITAPAAHTSVDPALSQGWYDCCTRRIDGMRMVEELLAANLRRLCDQRITQARTELRSQQAIHESLLRQASAEPPAAFGPHIERSIMGMVQDQSRRLQSMSDELDMVRATLNERKTIDRAKGLLMAHRQMSEEEAYKTLRQTAMNQNRRVLDVAQAVLAMADVLPIRPD